MKKPWLIQCCALGSGKLIYDYMGSSEFEIGGQSEALKRIFVAGVAVGSVNISVGGKEIPVYMVASEGFDFADYQLYLQQLADQRLHLCEPTYFDEVAKEKAGLLDANRSTNVWFDFQNDVLWALTESDQKSLVAVLEDIRKKWGTKK